MPLPHEKMEFVNYVIRQRFDLDPFMKLGEQSPDIVDETCFVGVEWEAEGMPHAQHYMGDIIHCVHDGSLKYEGVEARFSRPCSGADIVRGLHELESLIKAGKPYTKGERGSTHIHIDVSDLLTSEVVKVISASWILEPFLFTECPPSRANTVFCVPIHRTRDFYNSLRRLVHGTVHTDQHKYRAVSLSSVREHGTVEYRMFDTETDMNKILKWINYLQRLRQIALDSDLSDFKRATQIDVDGFISSVVGYPVKVNPTVRKRIWSNLRNIEYAHRQLNLEPKPVESGTGPSFEMEPDDLSWLYDLQPPTTGDTE